MQSSLTLTKKQLKEIPAISFKQPWAWAIMSGIVDVDFRDWKTKHKGLILVHASSKYDKDGEEFLRSKKIQTPAELQTGGIIGMVTLVSCEENLKSKWKQNGYAYGFQFSSPIAIKFIPCLGNQRIFYIAK